jgi:hypothetical protein
LPDACNLYLAAILRDTPVPAPALSAEEWREFVDLLRPHGIYALLAYRLGAWPESRRPPKDVRDVLKRQHLLAAARAMRAGRQIQRAVDALEAAGIPSVLLTGPALARMAYPDPALRQSSDIDLLIRPSDVLAAETVLESLGYVSPKKEFHISQYEYHHQVFEPSGNKGLPLELHSQGARLRIRPLPGRLGREGHFPANPSGAGGSKMLHSRPRRQPPLPRIPYYFPHEAFRLDWIIDTAFVMAFLIETEQWKGLIERSLKIISRSPVSPET